jgi:pimeloyl-ACP methyl ester carboxylesterase
MLHGVLGSARMWRDVVPLVARHHDAIAITALGHNGGNRPERRPARVADVIDDAERTLDKLGIRQAHLAGNSLGGWEAFELARRGRALSVCALSPAGCWSRGESATGKAAGRLRRTMRDARLGRPLLPFLARWGAFRKWAMRLNAYHGDRMAADLMVSSADDLLACEIGGDILKTDEAVEPFASLPCPMLVAWSEHDHVLPMAWHRPHAEKILPGARFMVLKDVGHVPMFDDPELVARTILECTGAVAAK